jgi:acyl carrier protein
MKTDNTETRRASANLESTDTDSKNGKTRKPPTVAEIQAWIVSYLAKLMEISPEEVDATAPFDRYGLDSAAVVGMTGDLEEWLGYDLDPTLPYDYPTIEAMSRHLAETLAKAQPASA